MEPLKVKRHGVVIELSLNTTFQGRKFWIGDSLRDFWMSGGRFLTHSTNPASWSFASDLRAAWRFSSLLLSFATTRLYILRAMWTFGANLTSGSAINGNVATVSCFWMLTVTDSSIRCCSISSLKLSVEWAWSLQSSQTLHFTHLYCISDPTDSASSNFFNFCWTEATWIRLSADPSISSSVASGSHSLTGHLYPSNPRSGLTAYPLRKIFICEEKKWRRSWPWNRASISLITGCGPPTTPYVPSGFWNCDS